MAEALARAGYRVVVVEQVRICMDREERVWIELLTHSCSHVN